MPLLLRPPTERVQLLTPGEWVEVKTRLSKGDMTRIESAAFRLRVSVAERQEANADVDYDATVFTGLEVGIVAWSFPEPVTPANIRALDPDDYDILAARVNELWSARKDDDRKNSPGLGVMPSSGGGTSLPISDG